MAAQVLPEAGNAAPRALHQGPLQLARADPGRQVRGQMVFSSGWEWGYWLGDVVAARAAWNPRLDIADETLALTALLTDAFRGLGAAGLPTARALVNIARDQHRLLIRGQVNEEVPSDVVRRTGLAYLQGIDAWDDVSDLIDHIPGVQNIATQPTRVGLLTVDLPFMRPRYESELRPLLAACEGSASACLGALKAVPRPPGGAGALLDELVDAARLMQLRATQILALYDVASRYKHGDAAFKARRLAQARAALDEATAIVTRRETSYRMPAERIAGWGANPTAYEYGYLWTVRSLAYWWRDEGKVTLKPRSPCFVNIVHPAEVATAEGADSNLFKRLESIVALLGPLTGWASECLRPPTAAPDLRQRIRP